jgi:hypothetical protein
MISMATRDRTRRQSNRVSDSEVPHWILEEVQVRDLFVLFGVVGLRPLLLGRGADLVDGHELARRQGNRCYEVLADP